MKKIVIALCTLSLFAACSGTDSKKLAQDVCDCNKKANAMDASDPKRSEAQNECVKKQGEAWNKVKDDQKQADEFNKVLGECSSAMLKEALGK